MHSGLGWGMGRWPECTPLGTEWYCQPPRTLWDPSGFGSKLSVKWGLPEGVPQLRAPSRWLLPCPGRPWARHPLPRSPAPQGVCTVDAVPGLYCGGHTHRGTGGHSQDSPPPHPGPTGHPPTAQRAWEREALPFSPPRWETRGWRGCSGAVALGCPAERGSGCPWRAAASRWRGLGGPEPRSCQPGAPPAGHGLHASGASAAAPPPAPPC